MQIALKNETTTTHEAICQFFEKRCSMATHKKKKGVEKGSFKKKSVDLIRKLIGMLFKVGSLAK